MIHNVTLFGGPFDGDNTSTPDLPYLPATVERSGLRYCKTNWNNSVGKPVYVLAELIEDGDKLDPPASWTPRPEDRI